MKRVLLALTAGFLALCVIEGGLSLLSLPTLGEGVFGFRDDSMTENAAIEGQLTGLERRKAAAENPGLYQVHPDPLVGFVMRSDANLLIHEGSIRTDGLGLRVRPGSDLGPEALRLVVLGDSVAFGFGLSDDETLAHRLEVEIAAAQGPEDRPVSCRTVAMPGWNHRNAVHFLLDHWDELDPDLVLYMPIANDLYDTDGVYETGHRRWALDPASRDPWVSTYQGATYRFAKRALGDLSVEAILDAQQRAGAPALISDLSVSSTRGYDENMASIQLLERQIVRRGGSLALLQYTEYVYIWHLFRRLTEAEVKAPVIPLFKDVPGDLTLPTDAHPHGDTVAAAARWIAADLLSRGWVEGDPGRVPVPGEPYASLRASSRSREDFVRQSDLARDQDLDRLTQRVDSEELIGLHQIYGGVNPDGSAGPRCLFLLGAGGTHLDILLAPLSQRPDLYPIDVAVEVNGQLVGSISLTDHRTEVEARFALSAGENELSALEVKLTAERWVTVNDRGVPRLASMRPLRLAVVSP